jgi:hypothetical protein
MRAAASRQPWLMGLAVVALLLGGCAAKPPKPMYQWGGYQNQLYEYFKADGSTPVAQLGVLEEQLQKTTAAGEAVPPGLHAHLGLLKLKVGNTDEAVAHLETEKRLFPESTPYMDWLLKRAKTPKTTKG